MDEMQTTKRLIIAIIALTGMLAVAVWSAYDYRARYNGIMNEISSSRFMVALRCAALRCEKRDMEWYGKPAVVVHKMDNDDMNKAMKAASDLGGIFIFSGDCLLSSLTVPEGSVINSDINAVEMKATKIPGNRSQCSKGQSCWTEQMQEDADKDFGRKP